MQQKQNDFQKNVRVSNITAYLDWSHIPLKTENM